MMRLQLRFHIVFFLLLATSSIARAQIYLHVSISDSVTREALPFCTYLIKGTTKGGVADDKGFVTVNTDRLPVTLVFSMIGYRTKLVTVTNADQPVRVLLSPSALLMKQVTIHAEPVQTWHPDDAWTFMDYEFYDDYILALVAMQGKKGHYLVLLDTLGNTVVSLRIKQHPDSLFTDCLGTVQLCCHDSFYQVYYDYEKLSLPYASSGDEFRATMLPCRCRLGPYYYFSFSSYHGQKLDYYYINWYEKGKYHPFYAIHDSARIAAFNEDYDIRYFLMRRRIYHEYNEPVDSLVRHMDQYRAQLTLSDREQQWLSPVASPLVTLGSVAWIVNPLDSTLCSYTGAGRCTDSTFFSCLRIPGWHSDELYADIPARALYGRITGKDGISVFVKIDPHSGKEIARTTVEKYPYLTHPRIRGGQLFFLWKDPYSEQPVKLRTMSL